tara:strand:+ start:254 stop:514 length:261 start_codon:yes stop_codon:yes gene_type:complete
MKNMTSIDLHGVLHEDAEDTLEKFITDHFDQFPLKVITGNSEYFRNVLWKMCKKYSLGGYPDPIHSHASFIIHSYNWKKDLDNSSH